MGEFSDRIMAQLSVPDQLAAVLNPVLDASHTRLQSLLNAAYEFPNSTIRDIKAVTVAPPQLQHPLFVSARRQGAWVQTAPTPRRTEVTYDTQTGLQPLWIDIFVQMQMTLILETDSGEVQSLLTREVAGFKTLDEFRARFRYLDLDAFLAQRRIATLEELQDDFSTLLTQIQLKPLPPFDPGDPASAHAISLNAAILLRDTLDITAGLRDIKLARTALERSQALADDDPLARVKTPAAPVLVFPLAALAGTAFTTDALTALFAGEGVLALFLTPA